MVSIRTRALARTLAAALLLAASALATGAHAQEDSAAVVQRQERLVPPPPLPNVVRCPNAPGQTVLIDTRGPGTVIGANMPWVNVGPFAGPATFRQTLVRIAVPRACKRVNVVVEYEGTPQGWTIHLGDSPNNDGYGGSHGETANNAEFHVTGQTLTVWSAAANPAQLTQLYQTTLSLQDGALKFVVGNQYLTWGQPFTQVQSNKLFAIPDAFDGQWIYLGINRTVRPRQGGTGTGARRVMISYQ